MPRLYLFAEGETEQTFADNVLKPHLARFSVFLHRPILIAHARRKGVVHRGGGTKYEPMRRDIGNLLAQDNNADAFFTTMIDLYAISTSFPGLGGSDKHRHNPYDRVRALEDSFGADVGDRRFVPHIQLHEFEAYLFVDVEAFELFYDHHTAQIDTLRRQGRSYTSPELIDDGRQTAPSKRIIEQFPDYQKVTFGPQIAEMIGLAAIREACPHFSEWLTRLECLGRPINDV